MTIAGTQGEEKTKAVMTGSEPGWRVLREDEFTGVNCEEGTFVWREGGVIACSGKPVGVIRTKKDQPWGCLFCGRGHDDSLCSDLAEWEKKSEGSPLEFRRIRIRELP